ncbi:VanZ family protein [Agromyces seonyuensis]|nr:VanZ family protein [Agromyces seonyuensis]
MDRLTPGILALVLGGVLAAAVLVPAVVLEIRRRGTIGPARLVGWSSLLVYGIALLAYTLLPLPAPGELVCAPANLHSFQFLESIGADRIAGSSLIGSAALQQYALNVLLFVPLGFLLRAHFGQGLVFTMFTGLAVSMAVEATQATGVWWVYDCAYRVFDVDDLAANGLGVLLGSLLAWMLLPYRRSTAPDPAAPRPVTAGRRFLGMALDWVIVGGLGAVLDLAAMLAVRLIRPEATGAGWWLGDAIVLVAAAIWTIRRGSTPGETALLLVGTGGRGRRRLSRLVRFAAGVGGFQLLLVVDADWAAVLVGLVSVGAVFATRDRRGLAALVAGMGVADARTAPVATAAPERVHATV